MPNKFIRVNQIPVRGETQQTSLLSPFLLNITQNRTILKDRTINDIQIVLEDDEGNLLDLTMNYSLSLDVHIIPNKMLLYTNAITNGN